MLCRVFRTWHFLNITCLQHISHMSTMNIPTWNYVEVILIICQEEKYQYNPMAPQADTKLGLLSQRQSITLLQHEHNLLRYMQTAELFCCYHFLAKRDSYSLIANIHILLSYTKWQLLSRCVYTAGWINGVWIYTLQSK